MVKKWQLFPPDTVTKLATSEWHQELIWGSAVGLISLEVRDKFVEHMQDTHTCKQRTHTRTDARTHTGQMEQARQGQVHVHLIRMPRFLTPAMAPQSLRLGFELLIRVLLLFCRLPSLSLTLIKITSVYIYANTWQAADAPFSTLCSNKSLKKTKAREGESRTGAHLGVQPLAWSRCGTPSTVGENTPGHIQQQNKGKGGTQPPAPDYLFSLFLSI